MKTIEVCAAILKSEDKYLFTQRGYGEFKGKWEFPGGKVKENETHEETVIREIKEELNVDIKVEKFICTINHEYENFNLIMHCYLCSTDINKIELLEHSAAKLIKLKDVKNIDLLPADIKVLQYLN